MAIDAACLNVARAAGVSWVVSRLSPAPISAWTIAGSGGWTRGRGRPVDRRDLGADDRGGRPTGDAGGVTRAMPRTPTITAIADPDHFADLPAQPTARTPKSPYLPSSAVEQRANDIQDTSEPLSNRVRRLLRSSRRESAHRT